MMIKGKFFLRVLCICILAALLCALLSGCKARKLTPSDEALAVVGAVGDYEVSYEELYFLASNYDNDSMTADELWETVSENITANYVTLMLCEQAGVEYDEDELEEDIDTYIESIIESDFGGNRKNYTDALKSSKMTDHYVRFTVRTDLLYSRLASALAAKGEISTDDKQIIEYIKNNFVRTWHFMVADGKGESSEENRAKAQSALDDLKSGKTDMYELIGSAANEDLLIPSGGYAFARGTMDQAYEKAAFELAVYEYSEVITAKGELANGEYTTCHYVIQRLELDDKYIDSNYSSLLESYESSVISSMREEIKSTLRFVPNDYASSLDIKNLEPVGIGTDITLIIVITVCALAAVGVAVAIVFTVRYLKKKKALQLSQKASRAAKKQSNENF